MSKGMANVEKAILSASVELKNDPPQFWKAFDAGLRLHLDRLYGSTDPTMMDIAGLSPRDCVCNRPIIEGWVIGDQVLSLGRYCRYHALVRAEGTPYV